MRTAKTGRRGHFVAFIVPWLWLKTVHTFLCDPMLPDFPAACLTWVTVVELVDGRDKSASSLYGIFSGHFMILSWFHIGPLALEAVVEINGFLTWVSVSSRWDFTGRDLCRAVAVAFLCSKNGNITCHEIKNKEETNHKFYYIQTNERVSVCK